MNKKTYMLLAMALFLAVFASACGGQTAPTAAPAPAQENPAVVQPQGTAQQAVVVQGSLAPTCQNVSSSCTAPEVQDTVASETVCIKKVPYQSFRVVDGVTFEVLDPANLTCADNGQVVGGKHIIECFGTELWTTQVKLTNVTCGSNTLATGTGQCQEGYGFDSTQNCCAPVTSNAGNSVTINVNMGGCPDGVQP